jgi:hypothetical protein
MHASARPVASIAASVEIRRVTIAPSRGSVETEVVLLITRQTAGFWLIAGSGSQERQQQCRSAPNPSLEGRLRLAEVVGRQLGSRVKLDLAVAALAERAVEHDEVLVRVGR